MDLKTIVPLIIEFVGVLVPIIVWILKIANGMKCQHRTEMLRIYYAHLETKVIHQYEFENFVMLYKSYKALKGNSFIDKVYKEVQTWKVIL